MQQQSATFSLLGFAIWLLAALFFLYEFFLRTFVGSLAHQIIPDLHLNVVTFGIIGSAYYLTYGVMQIPVGILADKFGVKYILMFATLICALATGLFASAHSFEAALLSRILMGFGSSFAFVSLLYIAATWFPSKYFGSLAGTSQFFGTMGPLLAGGPLVMVIEHTHGNWRTPLWYIALVGVVLCILIMLIVKNKQPRKKNTMILLEANQPVFYRSVAKLFKNSQAWLIAIFSATSYAPVALLGAVWGTDYLQSRGFDQHIAAFMVSTAWVGYAIGCLLVGALSDWMSRRRPIMIVSALSGIAISLGITYIASSFSWVYGILFFCLGLASSGQNLGYAAITENVDRKLRASALGLNNGAVTTFDTFIPPLVGYLIYLSVGTHNHPLRPSDFVAGFNLMPILFAVAFVLALFFIKETYCKPQRSVIKLAKS